MSIENVKNKIKHPNRLVKKLLYLQYNLPHIFIMKLRVLVFLSIILLSLSLSAQTNEFNVEKKMKKHNFGIGIGWSTFPIASNVSSASDFNSPNFIVTNAFVITASIQYDYIFSEYFSFSLQPTFIYQYIEFKDKSLWKSMPPTIERRASVSFPQISVPAFINYRLQIDDKVNLITSLGLGLIFNAYDRMNFTFDDNSDYGLSHLTGYTFYETGRLNVDDMIIPQALLRTGLEINTKRKMQVLLTYCFTFLDTYNLHTDHGTIRSNNFRVDMLELGFNIFL